MTDDHGLRHDLAIIERRRMLGWMASGGAALLAGCSRASALAAADCIAAPTETRGPYPADGSGWGRQVSNVLEHAGIIRSDIRSSLGSSAMAAGVPVRLTLTLVDAGGGCAPLSGHLVYLWQCDRDGRYSLYDLPEQSWLRGAQVTDDRGRASFTTIYPATYPGRYPHMHFEVFPNAAAGTDGSNAILVSQLMMPAAVSAQIYAAATGYESSRASFRGIDPGSDFVLRDNDAADLAAMTPAFRGDVTSGFVAAATIGIA